MTPSLGLLSAFYVLLLGALGALVPFWGPRLEALGLDGGRLGLVMAMLPLGRLLSSPFWGILADRYRMAGLLLRLGCALALAGATLFLFANDLRLALAAMLLFSIGRTSIGPLLDATVLASLAERGRDREEYGRVRLWGSVGFMLAVVLAGWLEDNALFDPMRLGVGLLALNLGMSWIFPLRGEGGPAPILPALRQLGAEPFLAPLLALSALQALTLSVYDTFFSVHVHALGLPAMVTSGAVAVGVAAEIAVMRAGAPLLGRFGPARLLSIATAVSVPRWIATAWVRDPNLLMALQALHGVSFGVFWIAGVQLMASRAPAVLQASAQSLFVAASYGLGALVGALGAGFIRGSLGTTEMFLFLALASLLAFFCALWLEWGEARRDPAPPGLRSD